MRGAFDHWNRSPHLILGHRGYAIHHPQNTPAAFQAALEAGADGIELDVQKTADGRYVILHDPPNEATGAGAPGRQQGAPELFSTLRSLPPEAYLDVELKADTLSMEDLPRILEILLATCGTERLMISSFEPAFLPYYRERGIVTALLVGRDLGIIGFTRLLARLRPRFVNLPIQAIAVMGEAKFRAMSRALLLFGFTLSFWTVNTAEEAHAILPFARVIITDDTPAMRKLLESEGLRR